jgi:hypothetical protein
MKIENLSRVNSTDNPFELWDFTLDGKQYCYQTNPDTLRKASGPMYRDYHSKAHSSIYRDEESKEYPGWAYTRIYWELADQHMPMTQDKANSIILLIFASGIRSEDEWTMPA